jgi:hypothetical protein
MSAHRWYRLGVTALRAGGGGGTAGPDTPDPTGPTELRLILKNVNGIPGISIELATAAGALKAYRIAGGPETTDPISLNLGGTDLQVSVQMDRNEELRVRPRQGATQGSEKSCRRKGRTAGASAEVHVAELTDVRCVGAEWDGPDQVPVSDCLTPVVLRDDFATGLQWSVTFGGTNGTGHSETNNATGGNPGGYRHMVHTLPGMTSVVLQHVYTGGSYDPSVSGAIRHLHYMDDRIEFNPPFAGAGIGTTFRMFQGTAGTFRTEAVGFTSTTWQTVVLLRLTPSSFAPTNVNFTATGGPITFGYQRSNTNNNPVTAYTTTHGIDNWTVVVCH